MERDEKGRFIKKEIDMEAVKQEYDNGKTLKQIGLIFDVADSCILKKLREISYPMRKKGWHLSERQKGKKIREKMSKTRKRLFKEGKLDLSGKNNPAYIDGTYCSGKRASRKNWRKTRKEVLERDNYACKKCGRTKKEIRLDVHHKNPWRKCKNHEVENCITLCVSCHGKISGNASKGIPKKVKLFGEEHQIRVSL